jgi:hypothetical protein
MEKSADEIIEGQHRPASVPVDQEPARRIADHRGERLHELEADRLGEGQSALGQNRRQHEQNAVGRPEEAE